MNEFDQEIRQLLDDHARIGLPDVIINNSIALALAKSGDSSNISTIPEEFRQSLCDFALSLNGEWYLISNNGTIDYSAYANVLKKLVEEYIKNENV